MKAGERRVRRRRSEGAAFVARDWASALLKNVRANLHLAAGALVLLVVLASPFPVASIEWRWVTLWGLLLACAAPFLNWQALSEAQAKVLLAVLAAGAILGLYAVMQATGFLGLVPEHPRFYEARALLGDTITGKPSAVPAQTMLIGGGFGLALLVFCASFAIGADPRHARLALLAIGGMTVVNGLLGVLLLNADPRRLFWVVLEQARTTPTGTFPNRNHAATLFATGATIFASIVLSRFMATFPTGRMSLRDRLQIAMFATPPRVGFMIALGAMATGLTFAAGSRGGALALFSGFAVAYVLTTQRYFQGWSRVLPIGLGIAAAVALLSTLRFTAAGQRFGQADVFEDGRLEIFQAMLGMIREKPWFGFGLGSFEYVIPAYRPDTISPLWVWEYAHSGPLQLLLELGVPMGLFAFFIPIAIIGLCIRGAFIRRRDVDIPVIGAAVGAVGLVHSLVDFSLQIPGYMIVYASVLGLCAAQAMSSRPARREGGFPA